MLVVLVLGACDTPAAAPTGTPLAPTQAPTETVAPSPTPAPTATSTPALVTVISQTIQESGQSPTFTLTANIPLVEGEAAFNTFAATLVNHEITLFKESVLTMPPIPDGYGSYLDIGYQVTSAEPQALSLLVNLSGYVEGAAHPYHYAQVINFDLALDRPLALADFFLPDSDYLGRIAEYCMAELQTREFVDHLAGAAPIEANYALWNITALGLLITFNEYQVAPYAAGAQTVTVPSEVMRDLIAPNGPLGSFVP
jgi:hypothetical protein